MKTGIWIRMGRQPPSGLTFSVWYSFIISWFRRCLSSPKRSFNCIRRGVSSFILAIDL